MTLRKPSADAKRGLLWQWTKGAIAAATDFGDPTTDQDYTFCLFGEPAGTAPALFVAAAVPAGGTCGKRSCWSRRGANGFRWADPRRSTGSGGLTALLLQSGAAGKARIVVRGKGVDLSLPALPVALPLRAQLQRDGGACWDGTFGDAGKRKNSRKLFRGNGG